MGIADLLCRLGAALRPYWKYGLLISAGLLLEMGFYSLVPFSFKFIVDDGLIKGDQRFLITIIVSLGAGAIVVSAAGLGRDYLYAKVVANILSDLRLRMFEHLQRLSMDFYARAQAGDILARFSGDLASVEAALVNALPWGVLPGLDVVANTALLFVLNWRLALVALLVWPVCILGPRSFAPRAVAASYARKQDEGLAIAAVQENIGSQALVKAFGLHDHALSLFRQTNTRLSGSVLRLSFLSAMVERSASVGIMVLQVLVLGVGAWMASRGLTTVGALAAFQALFTNLCYSLSYTTQYVPTLVQATGGMHRIEDLLHEPPSVTNAPDAEMLPPFERDITLQRVTFGYTPEQVNLQEASLIIPAGQFVALVGASGSGKSTILNQVMRLYDPLAGAVLVDGRDLRRVTLASLRSQMSVVFQDSLLFNTTIAENIRLGRLDASLADIEQASRAAEIHDFIVSQPQGYDTVVGERGGRLSGGQRQRIAIARAIIRNPRVLLLDEATSALDPATETAINRTLAHLGRGRTVIAVTHRLASVVHADCIFVLEAGRVIESGRHDELLERRGAYHDLWMKQSGITVSPTGDQATINPDRLRWLQGLSLLDDELRESAARLFVTEQYPQDRVVITEGDPADRFYVIARGKVEVFNGRGNASTRVAVLVDGDSFGEVALLKNVPRNASVRTLTPCTVLSLQREQFAYLLHRSPLLRAYLEHVSEGRAPVVVA